jgi:lipopolysaccharide export system protein LptC
VATAIAHEGVLLRGVGRDAAYRAAVRHSRRVRFLKRVIPVGAGLAVLFILVVMVFDPFRRLPANVSISSLGLNGTKIVMDAPRLQGYRKDAMPYEVTALSAAQDIKSPHLVELKDLDARITLGADGAARLQSPAGLLDSQKETLALRESVRVTTDSGYDARLRSALIEFKTGYVRSDEPMTMTMNDGSIRADAMEIVDSGRLVVFSGRVRSVLVPREQRVEGEGRAAAAGEENGR